MSTRNQTARDPVEARLDEISRLLALLLARDRPLQDTIGELSNAGIGPTRIADMLGTTSGYAQTAVKRARKKRSPKAKAKHQKK
jgi:hypothetical protein